MTTVIYLKNLKFHAYIGCFYEEKLIGQLFDLNLRIELDLTKPMITDNINDTINYQNVYKIISELMKLKYNLIEHAAYHILDKLWQIYPNIQKIELEINKLNPPINGEIGSAAFFISIEKNEFEQLKNLQI
ncbi:MAG: dihydroneopterin aldolase [Bacteroidales bacterium]|nr:dihydroneopterin aldolase [Bacteroidales bacterium]